MAQPRGSPPPNGGRSRPEPQLYSQAAAMENLERTKVQQATIECMKTFFSGNISRNLYLLVICTLIPALAIIVHSGLNLRNQSVEEAYKILDNLVNNAAEIQNQKTDKAKLLLQTLAMIPMVKNLEKEHCSSFFANILQNHPDITNILLIDSQGFVVASSLPVNADFNMSDRTYFKDAVKSRAFSSGEYILGRISGIQVFPFSHPVFGDDGSVTGVLMFTYDLDKYKTNFDHIHLNPESRFVFTDRNSISLFDFSLIQTSHKVGTPIVAANWRTIMESEQDSGHFTSTRFDGVESIFYFSKLRLRPGETPYMVALANTPLEVVLADSNKTLWTNLMYLTIATILALGIARLLGQAIIVRQVETIRDNEQRLQIILKTAMEGFWLLDSQGRLLQVNEMYCRMSGYTEPELLTMGIDDLEALVPPEQTALRIERVKIKGEDQFESQHRRKDGVIIDVAVSVQYRPEYGGNFVVFIRDITISKQSALAIQDSERHYREFVESTDNIVTKVDPNGRFTYVNKAASIIFGIPQEGCIGRYAFDFVFEEDKDMTNKLFSQLVESNRDHVVFENRQISKSGKIHYLTWHIHIHKNADGEICYVNSIAQDITERKLAEAAIKESQQLFHLFMDHLPAAVFIKNYEGELLYCNRYLQQLFGWADVTGKTNFDLFPTEIAQKLLEDDRRAIEAGHAKIEEEFPDADGGFHSFITQKFAIRFATDRTLMGGISVDITDQRRAEVALVEAKLASEAANRAKSEFLANMSHEIRTPLAGVLGVLQVLERTGLGELQQKFLEEGKASALGLLQIIGDILDLSKIEADKIEIVACEFDPSKTIETVIAAFRVQREHRGIGVTYAVNSDVPSLVKADEARLRQVLFNLVGNAVKFTERGAVSVMVSSLLVPEEERKIRLCFTVADTGVGIAAEKKDVIFEPFVQANGSYARKHQGTGLGLAIVKRLVTLMGGDITLESIEGKGTSVSFNILAERVEAPGTEWEIANAVHCAGGGRQLRILYAEDERINHLSLKTLLTLEGHDVVDAYDGKEVIDILKLSEFDLILMDVQMPVMDGVEATKRIRASGESYSNIPIIAMTAYAMSGDKGEFLAAGMDDYIAKPVEMAELEAVIQRVMASNAHDRSR